MSTQLIDDTTGFDEPTDEAPATTTKAALAITDDMSRISNAIGEFDRVSAGLADLEARYPKDVIYEVGTTKGMKAALEHRAAYRDPRISVEKTRRSAKAPVIALGKNIDARAAWLTDRLREGEEPVDQQIKAEEARKEAEREAKAAAEFGRVLAIQEALAAIAIDVSAACNKTSGDISALLERLQTTQPDPAVFQEMIEQAKAAWSAGISKLETAHKAKLWEEAEQRRVAAEQEAQRLAAQKAAEELERQRIENERVAAEQLAERERMAAERAEFERERAAMQAERDRLAAEAQARADEAARIEREAVEAKEREEAAALAAQNSEAQEPQHVLKAEPETADATDRGTPVMASPSVGSMGVGVSADAGPVAAPAPEVRAFTAPAVAANETPTLSLGEIKARIAPLQIDAAGLESLGFAAKKVKASCMYRESDWPLIHEALEKALARSRPARKAA